MKFISIFYSLFSILACTQLILCKNEEKWITIFVHGSIGIEKHLNYENCRSLFQDNILYSDYHLATERRRFEPSLFENQAIQTKGLAPIIPTSSYNGSIIFAQLFEKISRITEPTRKNSYYTFGWTGLVSVSMRYRESYLFYNELRDELIKLEKQNHIRPKIRIIGYSHGGNIALNLSKIRRESFPDDHWHVDELILLGAPLQKINAFEANQNDFFKKIYNIYSRADFVQCLDLFSPYDFFSNRSFSQLNRTEEQCHIYDIELRMHQLHNELLQDTPFAQNVQLHNLKKRSPGHAELWFFNWNTTHYRSDFCLNPLPISIFIPSIISMIEAHSKNETKAILLLAPQFGKATISNGYQKGKQVPFLSPRIIYDCKQSAIKHREKAKKVKLVEYSKD